MFSLIIVRIALGVSTEGVGGRPGPLNVPATATMSGQQEVYSFGMNLGCDDDVERIGGRDAGAFIHPVEFAVALPHCAVCVADDKHEAH